MKTNGAGVGLGLMGAIAVAAVALCFTSGGRAEAFDLVIGGGHHGHRHHGHGGFAVGVSSGCHSDGYYEYRTETYLVEAAHYENQWVPAQYTTVCDAHGCSRRVLVAEGYWTKVLVPARYETRTVKVWVPSYHRSCGPVVNVGLGFRF